MRLPVLIFILLLPPYLFALDVIFNPYEGINYSEVKVYVYPPEDEEVEAQCQEYDKWGFCIERYDCRNYDECE